MSAAFCPHPPLMLPEVAGTAAAELDPIRTACGVALRAMMSATPDQLVMLGSAPTSTMHSPVARGTLAPYGVDREVHLGLPGCGGAVELPLSLTIGAWLVTSELGPRSGTLGFSVGPDFPRSKAGSELAALVQECRVGLIVMGDGSARRSIAAPGYLDERAADFDAQIEAALETGDTDALEAIPQELGAELLAAGVASWRAAAALFPSPPKSAALHYAGAPYGVGYFVASWAAAG